MKAAVFRAAGVPLSIEDVTIDAPVGREVLVRVLASGVCHSDVHRIEGLYTCPTPTILGHEVSGMVEATGPAVEGFGVGDYVVACLSTFCGVCASCLSGKPYLCQAEAVRRRGDSAPPRLAGHDGPMFQFAQVSGFAERILVHENGLCRIPHGVPPAAASLLGCAVTTGMGAALNTANLTSRSRVVVVGCGGVGLFVVQGCRLAGARQIIAVDRRPDQLHRAMLLGATHTVPAEASWESEVIGLSEGGVDYAFEVVGRPETVTSAFSCTVRGGTTVVVGMIPEGQTVSVDGFALLADRKLVGCAMGSNRFRLDVPFYAELYLKGELTVDELITATWSLSEVNAAVHALQSGAVARAVLRVSE